MGDFLPVSHCRSNDEAMCVPVALHLLRGDQHHINSLPDPVKIHVNVPSRQLWSFHHEQIHVIYGGAIAVICCYRKNCAIEEAIDWS